MTAEVDGLIRKARIFANEPAGAPRGPAEQFVDELADALQEQQRVVEGLVELLVEARYAIEPLTGEQIRKHDIKEDFACRLDAAIAAIKEK